MKMNDTKVLKIQVKKGVAYLIHNKILLMVFALVCYTIVWHKEIVAAVEFIEEVI